MMLKKLPEDSKRKLAKKGYTPQDGYILRYVPVPPNCLSVPDISDGVSVMSSVSCANICVQGLTHNSSDVCLLVMHFRIFVQLC